MDVPLCPHARPNFRLQTRIKGVGLWKSSGPESILAKSSHPSALNCKNKDHVICARVSSRLPEDQHLYEVGLYHFTTAESEDMVAEIPADCGITSILNCELLDTLRTLHSWRLGAVPSPCSPHQHSTSSQPITSINPA